MLVQRNPAVAHQNVYFSNGNYERRSSKLADENANCRVVSERSYSCYAFQPLAARLPGKKRLPELASQLERLDCSHLFYSKRWSKLSTDHSSGGR